MSLINETSPGQLAEGTVRKSIDSGQDGLVSQIMTLPDNPESPISTLSSALIPLVVVESVQPLL